MSASKKNIWHRSIKRDRLPGGGRGEVPNVTSRSYAAYLRRLRRIEVVVLVLTMKMKIDPKVLDSMLEAMKDLADVQDPGSGAPIQGDAVSVPHEGAPSGETEGEG